MSHELLGNDTLLLNLLQRAGVPARRALELQNLMTYCGFRTFAVIGEGDEPQTVEKNNLSTEFESMTAATAELCILLCGVSETETLRVVHEASDRGATVAIVAPYADKERERMCRAIVAAHGSTTVDNRGYLLVFNNKCLTKQHYKI